ncbi:hypothetical protein V1525DRAFT_400437 [Lipomyces kononenkoae]|uniref:Uncharacterized protein n=1 Tax=Lipomyces kononenkoae TaxID=34357 RepID=A0ACC3T480_LIPKO
MTDIDPGEYGSSHQVVDAIAEIPSEEEQLIDDHSLSYQSVQQIHDAFSSFWNSYAEKLINYGIAGPDDNCDGGGVGCLAGLHKRYVDIYLASDEFNILAQRNADGRNWREERLSKEAKSGNTQIPDFSPEPEDLEFDERLAKVERQIKRLDNDENLTKPLIKKRGRRARKGFTEPAAKRPQLKATRGDRRGPAGVPRRSRIQARRGVLSCEVIVNRYSQLGHTYQATFRKSISGQLGMSKKKRKGRNKIDLDGLWATHWRLARSESPPIQKRRHLPFLRRALAKGKRCYKR